MNRASEGRRGPLAVVKVGSTSISVLAASTLTEPLYEDAQIRHLIRHREGPAALRESLRAIHRELQSLSPRAGLVAFGEVGRRQPELSSEAKRAGYPVWVLSGAEEGAASWWSEQPWRTAPITVVDVGGGSTEFAGAWGSVSVPVGAERPPGPRDVLEAVVGGAGEPVAMGGTARALATLFGNPLTHDVLAAHAAHPPSSWTGIDRVEADRRPLLAGGLATMLWAMDRLGVKEVAATPRDLRWGLWMAASLGRAGRWPLG